MIHGLFCCLHLILPPCIALMTHARCDSVVAGVARFGVFPLYVKACLRYLLAGILPDMLHANLALLNKIKL